MFVLVESLDSGIISAQVINYISVLNSNRFEWSLLLLVRSRTEYEYAKKKSNIIKEYIRGPVYIVRGVNHNLPFSRLINSLILLRYGLKNQLNMDVIHARTELGVVISKYLSHAKEAAIVWDCRGMTPIEVLSKCTVSKKIYYKIFYYIKYWYARYDVKKANRISKAAIFVSTRLREGMRVSNKKTLVVPCASNVNMFYFSLSVRKKKRSELGLTDSDILFVYSGSAEVWQCFDETIDLMMRLSMTDESYKFMVLSNEYRKFNWKLSDLGDKLVFCDKVPFESVSEYLNASDFGVLLRHNNEINKCSSPVKFAEYSLVGLKVISTEAVDQVVTIGREIGNLVLFDTCLLPMLKSFDDNQRIEAALKAKKFYDRLNYIDIYEKFYRECLLDE
ncbi:hypothetical protein [Prosthecochloris sp. HL-130-GSB]|uniref:hypothetical protein n=1 Tax=Prosthecochloris sp. HL-130-GSB TaxID=1974213 RepID=UPI0018DB5136|nr:hypothetical protein [Prosthecochloris sp. HL-130-GSB]